MSTTIKIRTTETQPFILLPTFINGVGPFEFVLDTGAGVSIITEELAKTVRLQSVEAREALGAGGRKMSIPVGQADSIEVGGSTVENARVGVMKTLPKCVGGGIIGHDFLRHFVLTIDYGRGTLRFDAPGEYTTSKKLLGPFVPLKLARPDRPIILVDVVVNACHTYQFILDTGASQTVVSPALAMQMGVRSRDGETIIGASGVSSGSPGMLKSVHLGDTLLEDVLVIVSDVFSPLNRAVGADMDGIIGYNILRRFTLAIDYPHERLQLVTSVPDDGRVSY